METENTKTVSIKNIKDCGVEMNLKITILEGALQAFRQKGLKFTMDDIAKILGISKKTIYTVFQDKEALFLAMVDYLSRENGLPLCNDYGDIRNCKLSEPLYPKDIILTAKLDDSLDKKEQCLKEAIPEFLRFNIIESEIRNVC